MSALETSFPPGAVERRPGLWARALNLAPVRALCGALLVVLAMCVVMVLSEAVPKPLRLFWPSLLACALMLLIYRFYALRLERRAADEFRRDGAAGELALGLLGGWLLVGSVFALLAVLQVFRLQGSQPVPIAGLLRGLGEMLLVASFEEILVRGIIFKAMERAWGSLAGLLVSSLLFGLLHLPNEGATWLSTLNVAVAGALFAAAYLASGRLWLGLGLHFGWNFCVSRLFSATVSGHKSEVGLLHGELSGADWLTGGAFGIEGSAVTLLVLLVVVALLLKLAQRRGRLLARPR